MTRMLVDGLHEHTERGRHGRGGREGRDDAKRACRGRAGSGTVEYAVEGAALASRHKLQLRDSIILSICARIGVEVLLGQDTGDGATYRGVHVINPVPPANRKALDSPPHTRVLNGEKSVPRSNTSTPSRRFRNPTTA